ncbi:MAG: threo-3-hydroxy-L-aspartate ammonia-lyase [Synechococcales cyanobacterium]
MTVTVDDIEQAAQRLAAVSAPTPVFTSRQVNARTGAEVFFKAENLQRTGSFKFRGAYNTLAQLTPTQAAQGVLAYSSGNHAQGVALAGQLLGIPTHIVMPDDAPLVKQQATRAYGAEVVLYHRASQSREVITAQRQEELGLTFISPFDHPHVIAGQGTAAWELHHQVGALDVLLVCVGGGGLLSGCAVAMAARDPGCRLIGVEPASADDATRSFHSGQLQRLEHPQTLCDGARTPSLGEYTFPLIRQYVSDMITVSEEAVRRSLTLLWERLKLVVEPTGALATAGLLEGGLALSGQRVGVILSGGNIDLTQLSSLFLWDD